MKPRRSAPDAVDLSLLDVTSTERSRDALVASIMARYRQPRPLDLWTAIAAYARPVGALAATVLIASVGSFAAVRRPTPPPVFMTSVGVPTPIAAWLARPSMPSPLEVMVAMAELPE